MADDTNLARTPLYDLHLELGARMVPFAGYEMPVSYPLGVLKEHLHTRRAAGLFDVSHMGQVLVRGADPARSLEALVPVDVVGLASGRQRYALFTNEAGGILDDLMVTNAGSELYLVVNAACKQADVAHLREHLTDCEIEVLEDQALLAVQGPSSAAALQRLLPGVADLRFMDSAPFAYAGAACRVSRSGYTGEDGFEVSLPAAVAGDFARALLGDPQVAAIGLGARDSLRLEAGLCLYGHDIDTGTTPVEAGLTWALSRVRRADGERAGNYPGAEAVFEQLRSGPPRKRVGLAPGGRAPVREGASLSGPDGEPVGHVTSGGFGPSAERPVAMGYVSRTLSAPGTTLGAEVRAKRLDVAVVPLPFVAHRYHRG